MHSQRFGAVLVCVMIGSAALFCVACGMLPGSSGNDLKACQDRLSGSWEHEAGRGIKIRTTFEFGSGQRILEVTSRRPEVASLSMTSCSGDKAVVVIDNQEIYVTIKSKDAIVLDNPAAESQSANEIVWTKVRYHPVNTRHRF
ncbi:MAG: hypothetical protein P9M14_08980 [Candidatus Alcyoniella australis]|nr:hypothetical protein [Candidatus Alcyoniella australis]